MLVFNVTMFVFRGLTTHGGLCRVFSGNAKEDLSPVWEPDFMTLKWEKGANAIKGQTGSAQEKTPNRKDQAFGWTRSERRTLHTLQLQHLKASLDHGT